MSTNTQSGTKPPPMAAPAATDRHRLGPIGRIGFRFVSFARSLLYDTPIRHWRLTTAVYSRLSRLFAGAPKGEITVRFRGCDFRVDSGDAMMTAALVGQTYESATLDAFCRHVRRVCAEAELQKTSFVFADVGANIGIFSIIAHRESTGRIGIQCFEPNPVTADRLRGNLALNGCAGAQVNRVAIADQARTAVLDTRSPFTGSHYLTSDAHDGIEVETTTLDKFFEHGLSSVKLIKIDVEGYEARVLKGAERLLQAAAPAVFLEFHPPNLRRADTDPAAFLESLLERFPRAFWIDEIGGALHAFDKASAPAIRHLLKVGANLLLHF